MSLRRTLPAGLLDAGASSAATFIAGLVAVRSLDTATLGAYALFFNAYNLAAVVPAQGLLQPIEIVVLDHAGARRLRVLRRSVGWGAVPAAAAGIVAAVVALLVLPDVPRPQLVALAVTSVVCAVLSPLQDHVRRLLHLASVSWGAAAVSVAQLLGITVAVLLLLAAPVDPAWVPLGALGIANSISLAVGLAIAAVRAAPGTPLPLELGPVVRSGGWLLVAGLLPTGGSFVVGAFVSLLASVEALGYAEAARIVAQPLLVLATGLSAVLGPRSMEAASRRDRAAARRYSRLSVALCLAAGAVYVLAVGFEVPWNLLADAFPTAYVVPGLVAVTVLANVLNSVVYPYRSELMAAGELKPLASVELVAALLRGVVAGTAGLTGAFAKPLAFVVLGVVRTAGFVRRRRRIYDGAPQDDTEARRHQAWRS